MEALEAQQNPATSRLSVILLDQGLFTVYKRLLLLSVALNITALVLAATGIFPYAAARPSLFSLANVLIAVLCRSEAVLRLVYWLAVAVLGRPWVPLRVKTATTSLLQSVGGIHSGSATSSICWLGYALTLAVREGESPPAVIASASAILGLLCLGALSAFPLVRHARHDVFELIHRFSGWTALAALWVFVTRSFRDRASLLRSQELWLTGATTALVLLPWLTVRKVEVQVSSPSGHASIIRFAGGVRPGLLGRISRSPLLEWHAFGIISDGEADHLMLAGAVGDFTRALVSRPPTHLWVRRLHFAGIPYLANLYGRVLLVATGSGISVFLSFLLQPCAAEVRLLWVTKNVETNFGPRIKQWVTDGVRRGTVIVHDTAVLGRPNVSELSVDAARGFSAEAVIVTSNPAGSRDIVAACTAAGYPAFGPIWDS